MTIGEFAARAGVTARTIRHYEQIGMLARPARSAAGYRLYRAADLERIGQIRALVQLGVSLRQVGPLLEAGDPAQLIQAQLVVTERELQRLSQMRDKLLRLFQSLKSGNLSVLTEVVHMLEKQEIDPILLELGRDLVSLVDPQGPQPLLIALRNLRTRLQAEGRRLGGIRVRDQDELDPRSFRLSLFQRPQLEGRLEPEEPAEVLAERLKPVFEEHLPEQ